MLAACTLSSLSVAGPASAQPKPDVTTEVNHFSTSQHFEAACGLPGATEYATGTEHLHVVEQPDGDFHVTYGETFWILEVSDDPTVAPRERHGTDALSFHLLDDGPTVFHESFHDKNTVWGDIFLFTTFVAIDGEVRVDHSFARNLPTQGC